ncbi:MAG: hypothetical protein ACRDZU_04570 [Acidimicrobiales bacterium]
MADRGDEAWEAALRRPDELVRGGDATSFTAHLDRWVSEARVDEAALQRSRERWLRDAAEQEATLGGVLIDLAERHAGVTIFVDGRRHHGVIVAIGVDFVALCATAGSDVLLAIRAVDVVRTAPAVEAAVGDRVVSTELRLADVLVELAADRERVRLVTSAGETVTGVLRNVGQDVVVVRTDGDPRGTAYVPTAAVVEVTIG